MDSQEAIEKLRDWLSPGDTVWTVLVHVSRSGMTRHIKTLIQATETSEGVERITIQNISFWVATALGEKMPKGKLAVVVQGTGMDMGFHLVYNLGSSLWPDGFETWPGYWRNEPLDFDPDGGYALRHRWL